VAMVTTAQIEQILSWQPRVLELRKTPLYEIVDEFNRQAGEDGEQIVIEDPSLRGVRIGGTFRADQADAFLRLMESSFGVQVERNGRTTTLKRRN
jgi:transmembrane sensor